MLKVRKELWMVVLTLALFIICFAPATEAGQRLSVQLTEPFEVNGQLYPAGELTVREVRSYSPVETLNEVCVNGECLGMLLAHDSATEERSNKDELIFRRSADGHLVLEAVAFQGQPMRDLYRFQRTADGGQWLLPSGRSSATDMVANAK